MTSNDQSRNAARNAARDAAPGLSDAIRTQVEYYFSEENLSRDGNTVRLMDDQRRISLEVLAGFPRLARLTADVEVIRRALFHSQRLRVVRVGPQWFVAPSHSTPVLVDATRVHIEPTPAHRHNPAWFNHLNICGVFRHVVPLLNEEHEGRRVLTFATRVEAEVLAARIVEVGLQGQYVEFWLEDRFPIRPRRTRARARARANARAARGALPERALPERQAFQVLEEEFPPLQRNGGDDNSSNNTDRTDRTRSIG